MRRTQRNNPLSVFGPGRSGALLFERPLLCGQALPKVPAGGSLAFPFSFRSQQAGRYSGLTSRAQIAWVPDWIGPTLAPGRYPDFSTKLDGVSAFHAAAVN